MYIARFSGDMRRARSNLYMGDAEERRIAKIRTDMWTHEAQNYTGGAIGIFGAICSAHLSRTKSELEKPPCKMVWVNLELFVSNRIDFW